MKHIVILKQKYFDMILSGEKTIESRFSLNKSAPYGKVSIGDELLLKVTGGCVTATAKVKAVEYYEDLYPERINKIRVKYGKQIGSTKMSDWMDTMTKNFCTLIWIEDVKEIEPINVKRSCGAGWIIIKE